MRPRIAPETLEAFILDLDGVVTDTARLHFQAWKATFDEYLERRGRKLGEVHAPFTLEDYRLHVDGKPRYDGVRDFLLSRGIEIPLGAPSDAPGEESVCGLGNLKNARFLEILKGADLEVFPGTLSFLARVRVAGLAIAVISASRNLPEILAAAGGGPLFDVRVGGREAEARGLAGKPAPDVFLEAARELGVEPARAAVVEDSLAGVEAARRGGFGLVIGVERGGAPGRLATAGADLVVVDLGEIELVGVDLGPEPREERDISELPSALERRVEIERFLRGRRPFFLLDLDGSLTEIREEPGEVWLGLGTRKLLASLATEYRVAVVSGRSLADLRTRVGVDGLMYVGSHGFEMEGWGVRLIRGERDRAALEDAAMRLEGLLRSFPGVLLERKGLSLAVHFRLADPEVLPRLEELTFRVAEEAGLWVKGGKKVLELLPARDWGKGMAVLWLVAAFARGEVPLYIGDDRTDEEAFRALAGWGVPVVVGGEERRASAARYSLGSPGEVREFLSTFLARSSSG